MLHELPDLHDQVDVFADRAEAGRVLAAMLESYRGADAVVMAIPPGGVPVAAEIARALGLPLDVAVMGNITLPWDAEAAYGAVAWDGKALLNDEVHFYFLLSDKVVDEGTRQAVHKVQRRLEALREGRPFPDLRGRTAILVDDGRTWAFTMGTAIETLRRSGASHVIVAMGTAPAKVAEQIAALADEVYCASVHQADHFAAADAYRSWRAVSDEEAKELLAGVDGHYASN